MLFAAVGVALGTAACQRSASLKAGSSKERNCYKGIDAHSEPSVA